MGCGASTEGSGVIVQKNDVQKNGTTKTQNGHVANGRVKTSRTEKNNNINKDNHAAVAVPAPVAFEVELSEEKTETSAKNTSKRFKRLEPIKNAPSLTADQLEEKLRIAEENRLQELDKKRQLSRRTSRLRQSIIQAQEIDQQIEAEKKRELDDKQRLADKNRELRRIELEQKKRVREERMRRAQERARRNKEGMGDDEETVDFDMEKDDAFNADDDNDSWTGDGSEYTMSRLSERIYSGRESPVKRAGVQRAAPMSASTCDSYDCAFQREPTVLMREKTHVDVYDTRGADDFFDT